MPKPYSKTRLNLKSTKHLSLRLGIPEQELKSVSLKAESLYSFDKAPKKNGGFREISKPHPRLKKIQSSIHRLLLEVRVANSAHGGIKGRSNLTNAQVHCNKCFLLNLDFTTFFPNISHYRVFGLFHKELGCSPEVASLLTRLTTVKGQVPQGGSMSTDIANLVMRSTDKRLEGLSKEFGITYTRYVDDMSFSGNTIPENFIRLSKQIISQSEFTLNSDKEMIADAPKPKIVTGLSVSRKRPNVPRKI